MALIYEKPASSSESLLSMGSDDPEANLPTPEPLGSSKAIAPAPYHKWWWRKKPIQSATAPPHSRSPTKPGMTKCTSYRDKYQSLSGFSIFLCDARAGLVIILFVVLAVTTLITVQFRDSELILALFTALALLSLALLYYYNCCASPNPWWSRKAKNGSGDLSPLVLPSTSTNNAEMVSVEKPPITHIKPSPHRRDWSLPTIPSIGILSHRRPGILLAGPHLSGGTPVNGSQSGGFFRASTPQLARLEEKLAKQRVEYSLEAPIESRIDHVAGALHSIAAATSKDAIWSCEARLAEALTWALTSCMSQSQLTHIKQAIDRELRRANANDRYCTLHGALFDFLQKGERDAILTHFTAVNRVAAEDVDAQMESIKPANEKRFLISDIDDTLVPTFKDRRGFAWGVPYPGVRQLYKELISGASTDEDPEDEAATLRERLAFVTARPGILRSWTKQELAKAGFEGSIILMGYASTATTPQGMLAQKVKQVRELKSLWPEFSVILVGDNGQRDIDLGAMLLKENLVEAVFIHDIFASKDEVTRTMSTSLGDELEAKMPAPLEHTNSSDSYLTEEDDRHVLNMNEDDRLASIKAKPMVRLVSAPAALGSSHQVASFKLPPIQSTLTPVQEKKRLVVLEPSIPVGWRHDECVEAGIDLFQTYAGAALRCYQKGLLKVDALERVARRCASDLGLTSCDGLVKQRLVDSLLRDVARVALEFEDKSPLEKVEFLEFVHEAMKRGKSVS